MLTPFYSITHSLSISLEDDICLCVVCVILNRFAPQLLNSFSPFFLLLVIYLLICVHRNDSPKKQKTKKIPLTLVSCVWLPVNRVPLVNMALSVVYNNLSHRPRFLFSSKKFFLLLYFALGVPF